ncbi:MAG TPA: ABC transporter substrate-binding protein, partial [Deinococcales bacterium]|nr:ABC transporter substrate-binding protein [Deinococcales bacterium]
ELYPLLATGKLDFVVGDAEDAILYRAKDPKGAPFKYVLALYQTVPNVIFSLASKGITTLAGLKGHSIGMPLLSGVSYTSLQAMLRAAGLKETDVKIQQIGFTQLEAVLSGRVDAAMGFINNEPVVLAAQPNPVKLNLLPAAPYNRTAGNGVIATDVSLKRDGIARKFLQATQAAMARTLSDPKAAFEACKAFIPNLQANRYQVLEASLPLFQSAFSRERGLGFSNPSGWTSTLQLLKQVGRVQTNLPASAFYTNAYLKPGVQAR